MERWREANPSLTPWVDRLGLDHVYTTPWFAILLGFFLTSLIISTYEQIRKSFRKTFNHDMALETEGILTNISEERLIHAIKSKGYILFHRSETLRRFIKHPWGYWGNTLLHLGIVVIIASSLIVILTEKRGALYLVEKEIHFPNAPWTMVDTGILAKGFILPEAVRLERVNIEFWESDRLKHLSSDITFIDPYGRFTRFSPGINHIVKYRGLRIYQGTAFGHAFFVEFTDKEGKKERLIFQINYPSGRDRASYEDFQDKAIPFPIRASYYVDADKRSMQGNNQLLNLLIIGEDKSIHEVWLRRGETGMLGPYTVKFTDVSLWSALVFVKGHGMYGIFTGFFIIVLGVSLIYFTPPREFLLKKAEKGLYLTWRASNFERFYRDEYDSILALSKDRDII
jgi:cytochrome c biogenesis protein ResB